MLWRSLERIPETYREPLILFYREQQSVESVAAELELSEDAVKQRLARGRRLLQEQVVAFVESTLQKSAPGPVFTLAVLGAISAVAPQTAKAVGLGTAVKGAALAAKSGGALAWLAMWLGPVIGMLGGIFATWTSIRRTETRRERQFMVRYAVGLWLLIMVSMGVGFALPLLAKRLLWGGGTYIASLAGFWALYGIILVGLCLRTNRRHRALRKEEGLAAEPQGKPAPKTKLFWLSAGTVASVAWMIGLAMVAKDWVSVAIVSGTIVALIAWGAVWSRSDALATTRRFVIGYTAAIGVVTLGMLNWRLDVWLAAFSGVDVVEMHRRLPLWSVNLLIIVLVALVGTIMVITMPRPTERQ